MTNIAQTMAEKGLTKTPPDFCYDLLYTRLKTEVMWAAVKLEVLDVVHELEPDADVKAVASRCKVPQSPLCRLLDVCAALGMLAKEITDTRVTYRTTQVVNDWLLRDSETSMVDWVLCDYVYGAKFSRVSEHVENGDDYRLDESLYKEAKPGEDMCKAVAGAMACCAFTGRNLVRAFDLSKYSTAVDLAGGVGVFAAELKKTYPHMKVNVLELPPTVAEGKAWWEKRGGQPDFTFIEGDIFKGGLPEADLYMMGHILLDWNEEQCRQILTNTAKAVKPGGAILVFDKVLPEQPDVGNPVAHLLDMKMLANPLPGSAKTLEQYRGLLKSVGFEQMQFHEEKGFNLYDAMLATRK